jgi:hypothetical protein
MEFLRFGSSIPGSYWGCCAVDIIQNFSAGNPDDPASIELVCGDGGQPIGDMFLGKTYREIFESRLRIGTFSDTDLPNHAFLCVLTEEQVQGSRGYAWLKVLKENGFEFIRAVDNSVYSGEDIADEFYEEGCYDSSVNYLFGLFRNIGSGKVSNPFQPPREWTELEGGVDELYELSGETISDLDRLFGDMQRQRDELHLKRWHEIGHARMYSKEQLKEGGVPITLAGRRSEFPQESEAAREQKKQSTGAVKPAPFAPTL